MLNLGVDFLIFFFVIPDIHDFVENRQVIL